MNRKIVAIGGGENGRMTDEGSRLPYETAPMDEEIIRLTGEKQPNFLMLAHASPLERQQGYFETMRDIYGGRYGCNCRILKSDELTDQQKVHELLDWADIIYEGGGNTLDMIALWKETGFNKALQNAWEQGKVMCGLSAGANCWFESCSTASLKKFGDDQPLTIMDCLGFLQGMFVPHCDEKGRQEDVKEQLKGKDIVAIQMSNCAALEVIDDTYRVLVSDASYHGIEAYGLRTFWRNGQYIVERLPIQTDYRPLDELYDVTQPLN
ncbi:MAG TPA: type 1 glutamine amidotransferase-like domain-containing protein [Clostridiales bacterium]|jgi:dipeptidase E|nr:type 1 glutamine amidotransferase-like domain-containing protein [Clostridiales bacterium]